MKPRESLKLRVYDINFCVRKDVVGVTQKIPPPSPRTALTRMYSTRLYSLRIPQVVMY